MNGSPESVGIMVRLCDSAVFYVLLTSASGTGLLLQP